MGEEERKKLRIEHEYWRLVNMWNMHEDAVNIDTQDDLHTRPAMYGFIQGVLEVATDRIDHLIGQNVGDVDGDQVYKMVMTDIFVRFWQFAQVCNRMTPPLTYESLATCTCGDFTDEDAFRLLEGKGGE